MIEMYQKNKFCIECGESFVIYQTQAETKKYCSYKCQRAYTKRKKYHSNLPPKKTIE